MLRKEFVDPGSIGKNIYLGEIWVTVDNPFYLKEDNASGVTSTNGGSSDLIPDVSMTNRREREIFATPLISADVFSSSTIEGKNPNIELTKVKDKLSSVTYYSGPVSFTHGFDGSFSTGIGVFSCGQNAQGDFTAEFSIPNGSINNGLSITINRTVGVGLVGAGAAVITYGLLPPGAYQLLRLAPSY